MFNIGRNTTNATFRKHVCGIRHHSQGAKDVVNNDRFKGVELQLTRFRSHVNSQIIANDLKANLVDRFRNDWVHLARHDARSRLHGWQVDVVKTTARAARQESQVVGNFGQLDRQSTQHTGEAHEITHVRRGFHETRCGRQLDTRNLGELLDDNRRVLFVRIDTRPNSGSAQIHGIKLFCNIFHPIQVFSES